MERALKEYLQQYLILSDEEFMSFLAITRLKTISKREHFVKSGEYCQKLLFTDNGYFRFYHLNEKGNEITSDFYFAPTFITSYTSLITGQPSYVNVQAMQDMVVFEFTKEDLFQLYNKYQNIERMGRLIAESIAINSEQHLFLLLSQSAEFRYKMLMASYPKYVNTIPLQYIASYLGIAKESLSRIRKSLT